MKKTWIIEGKYTSGPGSEWEELTTIDESEGGQGEAHRVCREYILAHPYGRHRVRKGTTA